MAREAPEALRPLYEHSASQARANHALILRFGRFPHRNAVLGRASTPEEKTYVERGEFIHHRAPPQVWCRSAPFRPRMPRPCAGIAAARRHFSLS